MASAAVATSINKTPCVGNTLKRNAPAGGATNAIRPCKVWFIPLIRVKYFSGTIKGVDADMAGK